MNLADLKGVVILIALIALIGAATAIALDEFGTGMEGICGGTTYPYENQSRIDGLSLTPCQNQTSGADTIYGGSINYGYNISIKGIEGVDSSTSFLGTIGTIAGVAVLIGIVVMAFSFGNR